MSSSNRAKVAIEVILILVLVVAAAYVIESDAAGVQAYDVYPTNSMLPTLEVGDLVIVQSVSYSSIHVGEVIVFAMPDQDGICTSGSFVIVHRVVNITAQGLITQGDNRNTNPDPDEGPPLYEWPPVPAACVKGVVMVAVPYLGRITEAFPPPYNYLLVAAILVLIIFIEARPNRQPQKEDNGKGASNSSEDIVTRILSRVRRKALRSARPCRPL